MRSPLDVPRPRADRPQMARSKNSKRKKHQTSNLEGTRCGRVTGRVGPVFLVETESTRETTCIARGAGKRAVVGDRVRYMPGVDSDLAEGLIVGVEERQSELVRRDALGKRQQVLAANVDKIMIVSAVEPTLREGLIDRYIVAAEFQGIAAELIINKMDLLSAEEVQELQSRLGHYPALGYPVHCVSAVTSSGLAQTLESLGTSTSILVGHSGVGKTSLINQICPGVSEKVQAISEATGRGQHTTTTSALYRLPLGGEVIDSPGVRSFGLWGIEADGLRDYFREFADYQPDCRFGDCQHVSEPRCAVRAAVDAEQIHPTRYQSYLNIRDSLLGDGG